MKESLSRVVLSHINAAEPEGKKIAGPYGIYGYPTLVLADVEGRTIDRWIGYSRNRFLNTLDEALGDLALLEDKRVRYEQSPNRGDAAVLGRYYESRRDPGEAVTYFRAILRLDPTAAKDYVYPIFKNVSRTRGPDSLGSVMAAADSVLTAPGQAAGEVVQVCLVMARLCRRAGNDSLMAHYLRAGIRVADESADERLRPRLRHMQSDHALYVERDTARAVALMKATFPEDWENNSQTLALFSHWCYENDANLEEAGAIAEKAVRLAKPGKYRSCILYQLATTRTGVGKHHEALALLKRAEAEDPESPFAGSMLRNVRTIVEHEKVKAE